MNTITIELCAEDRARIDNLAEKLDRWFGKVEHCLTAEAPKAEEKKEAVKAKPEEATAAPDPTPADDLPFDVDTPEAKTYKLSDVQSTVVRLSAAGKKDAVREIVKSYAEKVSAIPVDKFGEVMEKLQALEG